MSNAHLKQLLDTHGMTQSALAQLLGRDKSAVTLLVQGKRHLKAEEAKLIATTLEVPVTTVLGMADAGEAIASSSVSESVLIPFQGEPLKNREAANVVHKEGAYYLEESQSYGKQAYALEVKDNSLNLSGILLGDVIISAMDKSCKNGDVVVVQHYAAGGAETLLRKYTVPMLLPHSSDGKHVAFNEAREDIRIVSPVIKLVRLL